MDSRDFIDNKKRDNLGNRILSRENKRDWGNNISEGLLLNRIKFGKRNVWEFKRVWITLKISSAQIKNGF